MTDEIKLNVDQRTLVRAAITSHDGWKTYRREQGIDASNLGTAECLRACAALGIDIYATLAAGARNTTTQQGDDMKERNIDAATFAAAVEGYTEIRSYLPWDGAENVKCDSIIATVQNKQGGAATSAQYMCLIRAIEKGDAARATKTGQAQTTATTPPALEASVVPSANATAADPAGAALAAMVLPHIVAGLNQSVTRLVEARLENVQTVRIEVARHDGTTGTTEGHTHPQLARLLRACSSRMASGFTPNVMLVGPTGTGKTHAAHQVASALGLEYYAHGAMSMSHELLGFTDAHGTTHRTPFRDAFERGGLVILDELDSWDAGVTLALNAALANGYAGFPDGMVARHRDCVIIGAGNTHGTGATADFVGRNRLDAAFLSRFPVKLQWDADPALEVAISGDAAFARRVQAARERARAVGLKHLIDMRQMQAGAALIAAGFTSDEAADLTYLAGLSADQRRMIEGV
jgi:cobaltochelatase CobS